MEPTSGVITEQHTSYPNEIVAGYAVTRGPNFDILRTDSSEVFMWRHGVAFEELAIQQLANLAQMPFVYNHIAAMPDTHWGMGATVGSVYASLGAVIPAAVGVDIGCGMIAARTNLNFVDLASADLSIIRDEIERRIPMGRTDNGGTGDRGSWHDVPADIHNIWNVELALDYFAMSQKHPGSATKREPMTHLGTLGTGNHFIELQFDKATQDVWVMLHSGSRGVGNKIGTYFINQAKELMKKFFITLPDPDLAYLPQGTELYDDYIFGLKWAQKFAFINREIMLKRTFEALSTALGRDVQMLEKYNTHHNYATFEKHFGKNVLVTRKGAIRAGKDEIGIIPGSMGTRSYIVRGLGNPLSFCSCSHGAGRAMSRNAAVKTFTLEDHAKATAGVECDKGAGTLDETPGAYKNIDSVIEAERDLVEVVHSLKQIVCCKGITEGKRR